jgi:hypothetical protein
MRNIVKSAVNERLRRDDNCVFNLMKLERSWILGMNMDREPEMKMGKNNPEGKSLPNLNS